MKRVRRLLFVETAAATASWMFAPTRPALRLAIPTTLALELRAFALAWAAMNDALRTLAARFRRLRIGAASA